MDRTRLLVVGGAGMLGHKLVQVLGADPDMEVHCTVRREPEAAFRHGAAIYHTGVDLGGGTRPLQAILDRVSPVVVINAVGAIKQKDLYAGVDETYFLNATLPHLVALLSGSGARLIHLSTDCVFRGDRGGYTEEDTPDVEDLYGRSKACGEVTYGRHLTLRTSIIGFEPQGHLGLVSWFLSQPPGSTLRGFTRAIYSGLPTVVVGRTIRDLIVNRSELSGLYHLASQPIDKFHLLQRLNQAFDLGHHLIPDPSFEIDRSLVDTRFREATGTVTPGWQVLIDSMVDDFGSLPYSGVYDALRNDHSDAGKVQSR